MKKILLSVSAVALLLGGLALSQTKPAAKHHVVFQLSEDGPAWGALVMHVNNTMKALEEDGGSQVEVVCYGPGLALITKASREYETRLKELADKGVKFVACRNSMKMRKVSSEDLFPFVGEVESGIAEIVRKEESGWAYIH